MVDRVSEYDYRAMTFVTKLTLKSGDRLALDSLVDDIRQTVERKGVEFKGPHTSPPNHLRVPQYRTQAGDTTRRFRPWKYTVYERSLEIVGHEDVARLIADWDFPRDIYVEVEVDRVRAVGSR